MGNQRILNAEENYKDLDTCLREAQITRLFLVCGNSIKKLDISDYIDSLEARLGISVVKFSEFSPNPTYESTVQGVRLFREQQCDGILAVGGGSAMDVAKCVKLFSNMDPKENFLSQSAVPNDIPLFAVPTTAGTGSEATRFAVIYYEGEKQSITNESLIPSAVLFQEKFLIPLPEYQKKAAMLDALCHGIESFWSINSTKESREFAASAISSILMYGNRYLENDPEACRKMLLAAYQAGKAINITKTTAGHAMCYKLTSLYGVSHGHAAALCVRRLWPYMLAHLEDCVDPRGQNWLKKMFLELAGVFGADTMEHGAEIFQHFVSSLDLEIPFCRSEKEFSILTKSVNTLRLKNNPISLTSDQIDGLYHEILRS